MWHASAATNIPHKKHFQDRCPVTPEGTILDAILSGRLPLAGILIAVFWWIVTKGEKKLDALTLAVASVAPAITAHKVELTEKIDGVKTHVTEQTARVIAAVENHRLSELTEAVVEAANRSGSVPDTEPPRRHSPASSRARG